MATNTINAATNARAANAAVEQIMAEPEQEIEKAKIAAPSETLVTLPGGFISATGEVLRTAEVRELTGRDEEALGKITNQGRVWSTMLSRAVVSIGNEKVTDGLLDNLLAGDRDALLLGIYKATFGPVAELGAFCGGCKDFKTVEVEIDADIKTKVLVDPLSDRSFTVNGKKGEFLVTLPTGVTQRELVAADEKNGPELTTILLENTVLEINGQPVVSPVQIQNLGIVDRRKLVEEISKRSPGPQFEALNIPCPDCDGEVVVPISLGTLFRL